MSVFKQYRRTNIAEMRPVTDDDIMRFKIDRHSFSLSGPDFESGSPKKGDMIARNPKNHNDQWLVAEKYFKENFEPKQEES